MLENIRRIAVCVALAATLPTAARGADDRDALSGLRDKVVFEVTEGDGKALLSRLNTIEETRQSLIKQGTKPENVVPAVKVVGNSWISLMAYQAKGYSYISP
ncbi:MAG: hypothetical protein ACM3SO_11685 [Betaproteobacteria bacterium]